MLRTSFYPPADPELTPLGEDQARMANEAWKAELPHGIPLPQAIYCSPLHRALRTNALTFEDVLKETSSRVKVVEVNIFRIDGLLTVRS